ncbi:MAG: AIR synthase-related protein, partial [Pseudomonadota bacterium]
GFAVGAMERGTALPRTVAAGDILIGLASSGVHSNGYSLVRATVAAAGLSWDDAAPFANVPLGEALLTPTRIYVPACRAVLSDPGIRGLAHITGGGLTENLPRILPEGLGAEIDLASWSRAPIFPWLIETAELDQDEALRTYNCGIGMVVAVAPDRAANMLSTLEEAGENAAIIGAVTEGSGLKFSGTLG